jgi:hypothetical protein
VADEADGQQGQYRKRRVVVVTTADHVVEACVLVIEEEAACHEREEGNTVGLDIGPGAIIAAAQEHLRRDEHGCPADGME